MKLLRLTQQVTVAVGTAALMTNTEGTCNVAMGTNASQVNQTGSNTTAVGDNALSSNTADDNTAFGNKSSTYQ